MPAQNAQVRDPLRGVGRRPTQPIEFQGPVDNVRTFYAAQSAVASVTVYTAPTKQKALVHRWSICYTGADVGPETIALFIVTPAGAAIKFGQSILAVNETLWVVADGDLPIHLESSYGIRYTVTGGAQIDSVASGIEVRVPG